MYYHKMIGRCYGNWTVIGVDDHGTGKSTKMICRCRCGTIRSVDAYNLYHGLTESCGECKTIVREKDYMRCIMKNGASFLFDPEDEELVRKHSWSLARGHIRTAVGGKQVYLHRLLLATPDGMEVDHVNGNKLDNRKSNLRIASHSQNNQNKGLRSDSTTGYKGVCYDRRSEKYTAYINAEGKRTYLGYFDNPIDAARAYDHAALKLHGEFAKPNFGKGGIYGEVLEVEESKSA